MWKIAIYFRCNILRIPEFGRHFLRFISVLLSQFRIFCTSQSFQIIILLFRGICFITVGSEYALSNGCLAFLFCCSAWTTMGMTSASASSTWICWPSAGRILVLCWMPKQFPLLCHAMGTLHQLPQFYVCDNGDMVLHLWLEIWINNLYRTDIDGGSLNIHPFIFCLNSHVNMCLLVKLLFLWIQWWNGQN